MFFLVPVARRAALRREQNQSDAEELHAGAAVHWRDGLQPIELAFDGPLLRGSVTAASTESVALEAGLEILVRAIPLARARAIHR
jgi:hypothetical protein